jgi:hypothetical protein
LDVLMRTSVHNIPATLQPASAGASARARVTLDGMTPNAQQLAT